MENQPNIGDQNVQPVGQHPVVQPTVLDKPRTNFTTMFVIGLICSLVFGIGGYFLGKQSSKLTQVVGQYQTLPTSIPTSNIDATLTPSSEMSDWKTYTNQKFGFSIKYPSYAKVGPRDPDPFPVAIQIDNLKPRTGGGGGPEMAGWLVIISEPQKNPESLSLRDWSKSKNLSVVDPNLYSQTEINISDATIGGYKAIMWEFPEVYRYYLIEKDSTEVVFVMINKGDTTQVSNSLFDQILSSLKFLN